MKHEENVWSDHIHRYLVGDFGNWLSNIYKNNRNRVFPIQENVFKAFKLTPYKDLKVVIIGQDPYHGFKIKASLVSSEPIFVPEANGLAFSVSKNMASPPSLKNIFKSIKHDLKIENKNPDLIRWADQGVMLLNTALTVLADTPGSHTDQWEDFTIDTIELLNKHPRDLVFMLWGKKAQQFKDRIDSRHLILETTHPSPLSARKGFLTCKHFSKCNEFLSKKGYKTVDWRTDV
jgi:uracil-DNA glycosylase